MLKNAGVSDAVARDIIGHESEAISRQYTHIDMAAKRKAIESLPDILWESKPPSAPPLFKHAFSTNITPTLRLK